MASSNRTNPADDGNNTASQNAVNMMDPGNRFAVDNVSGGRSLYSGLVAAENSSSREVTLGHDYAAHILPPPSIVNNPSSATSQMQSEISRLPRFATSQKQDEIPHIPVNIVNSTASLPDTTQQRQFEPTNIVNQNLFLDQYLSNVTSQQQLLSHLQPNLSNSTYGAFPINNLRYRASEAYINDAINVLAMQQLHKQRNMRTSDLLFNSANDLQSTSLSPYLLNILSQGQALGTGNTTLPQGYRTSLQTQSGLVGALSNILQNSTRHQENIYPWSTNIANTAMSQITNNYHNTQGHHDPTDLARMLSVVDAASSLTSIVPDNTSPNAIASLASYSNKRLNEDNLDAVSNFSTNNIDNIQFDELVKNSSLTRSDQRGMVPDVHFAVIAQMKACNLTHEDRVGLYKTREIGCRGVCCKHCGGVPGFGRYFPGSLSSLVNGNITKSATKHLLEECRVCPVNIREGIRKLEENECYSPVHHKRGSRRQFFALVWATIQEGQLKDDTPQLETASNKHVGVPDFPIATLANDSIDDDTSIPWTSILEGSTVVLSTDRHLVPDTIFAATAQTKPCELTEEDRVGRCKDHKVGSTGLCCKHCEGKPGAFGRYFPSNLHTFAQVEVCNQIVKHLTNKCLKCPAEIRDAILRLQKLEETTPCKRYPSRMVFFRRVWHRFCYGDGDSDGDDIDNDLLVDTCSSKNAAKTIPGADNHESASNSKTSNPIDWKNLLNGSNLVSLDDQGLISDTQFVAIAQMNRCKLTAEDKIGYNKDREIGFVGLACRHCSGRPGFGRYFPNTVRNFEKTSARDTIVSHISTFCKKCPDDIRNAMKKLQRIESSRSGSTTMKSLVYGSGKVFFRTVWSRLHGEQAGDDSATKAKIDTTTSIEEANLKETDTSEPTDTGNKHFQGGVEDKTERKRRRTSTSER